MTLTERAAILARAAERGYRSHPDKDCTWIITGSNELIDEDELIELQLESERFDELFTP